MCGGGGKKSQEKAKNSALAKDKTEVNQAALPCQRPETVLQVFVVRSDTQKGVEAIAVEDATLGKKTSAGEEGLANFGSVAPGGYELTVTLTNEQAKDWVAPAKKAVQVKEGTTQKTVVSLDPQVELHILVSGYDAEKKQDVALKDIGWKMTGPTAGSGKTGADGLIKIGIPYNAKSGTVELTYPAPTETVAAEPKPASTKPEDYPVKIQPDAFEDTDAGPVVPAAGPVNVKWTLTLVDLADGDNEDGTKARLWNLAFPVEGDSKAAVRAYQRLYEDNPNGSGVLADVQADVKSRHDG